VVIFPIALVLGTSEARAQIRKKPPPRAIHAVATPLKCFAVYKNAQHLLRDPRNHFALK